MSPLARLALLWSAVVQVARGSTESGWRPDGYHVFPDGNIQDALDAASRNSTNKVVRVHAGVYRPKGRGQALVWFTRAHEGVVMLADGPVTLTAANPELSDKKDAAYPAVVNHVVYFGDGVSPATVLRGFRITGANHFVTTQPPEIEPGADFAKNLFFYADGGAIKIFGRSSPTLRQLTIEDNYASPCAGGVSVQQQWLAGGGAPPPVRIEDCLFSRNRSQITGAAVDLLPGSSAVISNCVFSGNIGNLGDNYISENKTQPEFTNSSPLTVFPTSRALVQRCTFTGNRNGIDDLGHQSVYQNCIFWRNDLGGAFYGGERYELDLEDTAQVSGCFFGAAVIDRRGVISKSLNTFAAPDPKFDKHFIPASPEYSNAGGRVSILSTNP